MYTSPEGFLRHLLQKADGTSYLRCRRSAERSAKGHIIHHLSIGTHPYAATYIISNMYTGWVSNKAEDDLLLVSFPLHIQEFGRRIEGVGRGMV